jgi:hypothetical protein
MHDPRREYVDMHIEWLRTDAGRKWAGESDDRKLHLELAEGREPTDEDYELLLRDLEV